MRLVGKVSSYDKIIAYMTSPEGESNDLTDHERKMLDRWMVAFNFQREYKSTTQSADMLMKMYPGLSRATAYRDCAAAISLFGDISKATKEGIRHLATEITKDAISLAKENLDYDAMIRGAATIAKINGVNLIDPDMPDFEKLAPHTFNISLPPVALNALMDMLKGGRVDLTSMVAKMQEGAQDVEFTEET